MEPSRTGERFIAPPFPSPPPGRLPPPRPRSHLPIPPGVGGVTRGDDLRSRNLLQNNLLGDSLLSLDLRGWTST